MLLAPVSNSGWNEMAYADQPGAKKISNFNRVGPGYFKTIGTALVAGRDFDQRDTANSPKVAIVNEAFAKSLFNGANPVGRQFRVEGSAGQVDPVYDIVGLVRNTKYFELREDFLPIAVFPMTQDEPGSDLTFVVQVKGPVGDAFSAAKAAAAEIHPEAALEFRVISTQLKESLTRERLMATLTGGFGFLAAFLATLGLYGVIAYMVERRRNEIGVRMALGAGRGHVIALVMREAAMMVAIGLVIGIALALWAGRTADALLYGLKPHDPLTLAGAALLLAAVAMLAAYAPALRAARLHPVDALRRE